MTAWLCLGSNLNDPLRQINQATNYLHEKCFVNILRESKVLVSNPFGVTDQPDFANQLVQIETTLDPFELLAFLKNAELELGRQPSYHWGPRSIDLDIIFYEDRVINTTELTLPHPGVLDRAYLTRLLYETIPDYIHPATGESIRTICYKLLDKGEPQ